jgi:hypothetical protein
MAWSVIMAASFRTTASFAVFTLAALLSFAASSQTQPPVEIFRTQITGAYGCDNTFRCFSAAHAFRQGTLVAHATGPAISIQIRGPRNNWPLQQLLLNTESRGSLHGPVALGDDVLVLTGSSSRYNFKQVLYVYSRANGVWSLIQTLVLFRPEGFDRTEVTSLAIDGNTLLVAGTRYDDSAPTRVLKRVDIYTRSSTGLFARNGAIDPPGQQADGRYTLALKLPFTLIGDGAAARAFMYERTTSGWRLRSTLAPDGGATDSGFAAALAMDGRTALIGAPGQANTEDPSRPGAVYVYRRDFDTPWQFETIVTGPPAEDGEHGSSLWAFGQSLALEGGRALIGAGDINLAFLYEENAGWIPQAKLTGDIQMFPNGMFLSDGTVMVNYYALFGEEAIYVFELPQLGVIEASSTE